MLGLPVIVSECEIYSTLLSKFKYGASVTDLKLLKEMIPKNSFSSLDTKRLYHEVLDPIPGISRYLQLIN
jgi:hypothetical protein